MLGAHHPHGAGLVRTLRRKCPIGAHALTRVKDVDSPWALGCSLAADVGVATDHLDQVELGEEGLPALGTGCPCPPDALPPAPRQAAP